MALSKLSLFVAALVVALAGSGSLLVSGGILDDINRGFQNIANEISNTACVASHIGEFNACYDKIKDAYKSVDYRDVNKDDLKDACCSYLAYRDCVEAVAYKRCGGDAAKTAQTFMNAIKGASSQCDAYNTIFDCMDPVVLVAVIIVLAIVGIAILACLVRICQSCCRC